MTDPLDTTSRIGSNNLPRIIVQDTCMGIDIPCTPRDDAFETIQLNGDLINFGEAGPGANDRYTPEAAQQFMDKLIQDGYSNHRLFQREWLQTSWPPEPRHVKDQLQGLGISRMSLDSPGRHKRR